MTYTIQHNATPTENHGEKSGTGGAAAAVMQDVSIKYALVGGYNGLTLALDLEDPSECSSLQVKDEHVRSGVRFGLELG